MYIRLVDTLVVYHPQSFVRYKGTDLEGMTYEPLFKYYKHRAKTGAFRMLVDTYVTDASGTGIVHQSPYFGEVGLLLTTAENWLLFVDIIRVCNCLHHCK